MAIIHFENIILRSANASDYSFFKRLYSYEDIIKYCTTDQARIDELCEELSHNKGQNSFIIQNFLSQDVGYIAIIIAPIVSFAKSYWVQYAIEPMYRNCGYATSALKAITKELQDGTMPISLLINDDNDASQKVAINCGFNKLNLGTGVKGNGQLTNNESTWVYGQVE